MVTMLESGSSSRCRRSTWKNKANQTLEYLFTKFVFTSSCFLCHIHGSYLRVLESTKQAITLKFCDSISKMMKSLHISNLQIQIIPSLFGGDKGAITFLCCELKKQGLNRRKSLSKNECFTKIRDFCTPTYALFS